MRHTGLPRCSRTSNAPRIPSWRVLRRFPVSPGCRQESLCRPLSISRVWTNRRAARCCHSPILAQRGRIDCSFVPAGGGEPAGGTVLSLPDCGETEWNRLFLRAGSWLTPGGRGELLVGEAFADANQL